MNEISSKTKPNRKTNRQMKTYLVTAKIQDGEHEHTSYGIIEADNETIALAYAEESAPRDDCMMDTEQSAWTWGDGTTSTEIYSVKEITKQEAKTLVKLRVVFEILTAQDMMNKTMSYQ